MAIAEGHCAVPSTRRRTPTSPSPSRSAPANPPILRTTTRVMPRWRPRCRLAPDHFEAGKVRVWLLLGPAPIRGRARARHRAQPRRCPTTSWCTASRRSPTRAGHYAQAETSAQWMLDLRPGSVPGLTRAAYLRELFGDIEGAIELMGAAVNRMPSHETEDRAWLLTHLGHLELVRGSRPPPTRRCERRSRSFRTTTTRSARWPGADGAGTAPRRGLCCTASATRSRPIPRTSSRSLKRRRAPASASRPPCVRRVRSRRGGPRSGTSTTPTASWSPTGPVSESPPTHCARRVEIERRRDVYTLDTHAWALQANGRLDEARRAIDEALAVGVQHPRLLERAAVIQGTAAKPTTATAAGR